VGRYENGRFQGDKSVDRDSRMHGPLDIALLSLYISLKIFFVPASHTINTIENILDTFSEHLKWFY